MISEIIKIIVILIEVAIALYANSYISKARNEYDTYNVSFNGEEISFKKVIDYHVSRMTMVVTIVVSLVALLFCILLLTNKLSAASIYYIAVLFLLVPITRFFIFKGFEKK